MRSSRTRLVLCHLAAAMVSALLVAVYAAIESTSTPLYISLMALPICVAGAVAAILLDISERNHKDKAFQNQQELLQQILTHIPASVFWKDRNSVYWGCNDNFARDAGISDPTEIIGKSDYDLPWTEEESDTYRLKDAQLIRTNSALLNVEESLHNALGEQMVILTSKVPLRDLDGVPVGLVGIYSDITELKKAEQTAIDSERFARSIVDALTKHIAVIDAAGTILLVNRAWNEFAESNGLDPAAVGPGMNYLDVCDLAAQAGEQEAAAFAAGVRQVITGQRPSFDMEYACDSPTEQRWFTVRATPFVGESPTRVVIAHENITARRLAEENLATWGRQMSMRADISSILGGGEPLGAVLKNCVEAIVFKLDVALARIWTLSEQADVLELQASAGLYTHLDGAHACVPVGQLKIGQIALERRAHVTNTVTQDPNISDQAWAQREGMVSFAGYPLAVGDRLIGVLALFARRPLTEACLAGFEAVADEIAIGIDRIRSADLLRTRMAAVEAADDMILIAGRESTIEYVNPAFTRTVGYSAEEAVGQKTSFLRSGAQEKMFYEQMWQTVLAGKVWRGELINRRKDGSLYPEEMTIAPVHDSAGEITRFVAIKRDISERKRADQIRQERQDLQAAVRAMDQVLGVIGHELRTPLAGIRAMAEYLLTDSANQAAQHGRFLKAIEDEVIRMAAMVNDILEVARINSGTARWNWSEFALTEVCREALTPVRALIDNSQVTLSARVEPEDLRMQGDPAAVRRLILNLVSNARQHTTHGHIMVVIRACIAEQHPCVCIEVQDTGCGMTPEIAERIGEAFALNSGMVGEHNVQGSGLGLAICRGIVGTHGGSICVESMEGRGTTVTVLLRTDLPEPVVLERPVDITRRLGP